jgi:two-component system LytT family sensor kinase
MPHDLATNIQTSGRDLAEHRVALIKAVFFVLVWPTFNLLFVSLVMFQLGHLEFRVIGMIAIRLYTAFGLAYLLILLLQNLFPVALAEDKFWPQLALHIGALVVVGRNFEPMLARPEFADIPQPTVVPMVLILFQASVYVLLKNLLVQRERHLAMQLNLRQARINMLRSQSNPHFLFNTLNLLASEIKRDPANAQDIVYDLADLLRESMRAAEREFISLDEELRLVTLYLTLQEKRFPERLAFSLDIEDDCRRLVVPALLLQPVVENVTKHVVARSSDLVSLNLRAYTANDALVIRVEDSGPKLDAGSIKPTGGLHIVRETLALHYRGRASMAFESTAEGGRLTITLPLQETLPGR